MFPTLVQFWKLSNTFYFLLQNVYFCMLMYMLVDSILISTSFYDVFKVEIIIKNYKYDCLKLRIMYVHALTLCNYILNINRYNLYIIKNLQFVRVSLLFDFIYFSLFNSQSTVLLGISTILSRNHKHKIFS